MSPAAKKLKELRERKSKEHQRRAELAVADSLTDETRAELDTLESGIPDLERQLRAAESAVEAEEAEQRTVAPGSDDDAESRELADLRSKVKLSGYVSAAVEQRSADGAEREYNEARGISGNRFPLELLAPPVEARATTDTDIQTTPRRWLDRLFAGTAAEYVGVTLESVPAGVASYPVTTAGASAAQRARSEAAADAAWTIGTSELKPKRNAVRLVFSMEDSARIPGLESALTRDLRMALMEGVDRAIFLGDATATGTDADIVGLDSATGVVEKELTQTAKLGTGVLSAFAELLDGKHAMGFGDLRIVSSIGAWREWEQHVLHQAAENQTLAQWLRDAGLSWMSRAEIADSTDDGDTGAFIGRARGLEGAGVAAVWEAGELIRDPYSGAASGEIALTLSYLWAFGLPRPSNFGRLKFIA